MALGPMVVEAGSMLEPPVMLRLSVNLEIGTDENLFRIIGFFVPAKDVLAV